MEAKVSEVLENILGLLMMEGSFEVTEEEEAVRVEIDTEDAGRLIGMRGETLDALQLLVNQMVNKQNQDYKRVLVDVGSWRKNKEGDLQKRAQAWADEVISSGKELELEPMPSWQRRVVHMVISETDGVESESIGEGRDRHLVIRPTDTNTASKDNEKTSEESNQADQGSEEAPAQDSQTEEQA